MSAKEIYCNSIRSEFESYYANWTPNTKLELGDFGYIVNNCFMKMGNLKSNLGIYFESSSFSDSSQFQIARKSDIELAFKASGDVESIANASVTVKFNRKDAVFLKCHCVRTESIDSLISLIEPLKSKKEWEMEYVIISDLFHTNNNTILISNNKGAEVVLECDNPAIANLNGNMNVGLKILKQSGTDFVYTSIDSIIPFVRVAKLYKRFLSDERRVKYGADYSIDRIVGDEENSVIFDLKRID